MTQIISGSADSTERSMPLAYWATYSGIVMAIIGFGLFTNPTRYADFDTYVYYLDALVHFPPDSWMYFEVFSNIYLLSAYWITQSVLSAVVLAHYGLAVIFIVLMAVAFPPRRSSWPVLLLMFAILGPLLAFVTMRATPAYFLVAIAVHFAIDRRPAAWILLLAASLFHISSLLALLPMTLLYFERNLPRLMRSDRSRRYYLGVIAAIVLIAVLLPELSNSLTGLVQAIPVISKYDAYTTIVSGQTQIGHYLFLAFVSVLTVAFLAVRDRASNRLNVYVLTSFALYVVMFFSASPVAAFRQTPFWIMPMIAVLPLEKLGVNRVVAPIFILACAGLFVFEFQLTYS